MSGSGASSALSRAAAAFEMKPPVLLGAYAATILLSAALLFAVQPMFAKMVLPKLGGAPSVWSVAMVFFQAALLAGYAYAHLLTRYLHGRLSVIVHVGIMLAATISLPLAIASGWGRPPAEAEAPWLLGLFAASIGLPFFALSANGPLLQAWFARTDHPAAANPYFLYAASNVGSFLALVSYPLAVEPFTRLGDQTRGWSALFCLLIALIAACGWLMLKNYRSIAAPEAAAPPRPDWREAVGWVALAVVPSGLLVAVTAHISTDIAAVPLLWVAPLALYLLTFVIVFQTKPILPHWLLVRIQPLAIVALAVVLVYDVTDYMVGLIALHLVAFFVIAIVCHGELARRRPPAEHLTAFYMWMSAGGVIGGIFCGLVAPYTFSSVAEYPLLLVGAILCLPGLALPRDRLSILIAGGVAALAIAVLIPKLVFDYELSETRFQVILAVLLTLGFALSLLRNPLYFAGIAAAAFLVYQVYEPDGIARDSVRSFFGVHKISETADGEFRTLTHGTTIHGAERIVADADDGDDNETDDNEDDSTDEKPAPLTYYHDKSALAQVIRAARERKGGPISLGVIGLGTGSLACQVKDDDAITFYEIDAAVVRIARDEDRFTFLSQCRAEAPIVLGDARLTLADAADGTYDVIVVDAFSSDMIPVHLLTREAMALFAAKLASDGVIAMHVSNRHMELVSVVAGIAHANGLMARVNPDNEEADDAAYKFSSTVVAVAQSDGGFVGLGTLERPDGWQPQAPDSTQWVWTDDYSNIIGAIIRQLRQ
jgi:hypothetical protein